MVLETTFRTPTGTVAITDALAMGTGNRGHQLGHDAPHILLRRATCIEGDVDLRLECAMSPGYGLVSPGLNALDGGVLAVAGPDAFVLSSPVKLTIDDSTVSGQLPLRQGETAGFALQYRARCV